MFGQAAQQEDPTAAGWVDSLMRAYTTGSTSMRVAVYGYKHDAAPYEQLLKDFCCISQKVRGEVWPWPWHTRMRPRRLTLPLWCWRILAPPPCTYSAASKGVCCNPWYAHCSKYLHPPPPHTHPLPRAACQTASSTPPSSRAPKCLWCQPSPQCAPHSPMCSATTSRRRAQPSWQEPFARPLAAAST